MAIETSLKMRQKWLDPIMGLVCLLFALWGAYDYFITIPRREKAVAEYKEYTDTVTGLTDVAAKRPLTADEQAKFVAAEESLKPFAGSPPQPVAFYDSYVQLWGYMIGCGVLGTPWFVWTWMSNRRRKFSMDDDGTVHTPQGAVPPEDIADIDMSKWMAKSIATLKTTDGRSIVLDDYIYKNMHLIVGAVASKFYPDLWTEEAEDRKKKEAKEAEEAAARQATAMVDDSKNTRDVGS